MKIISHILDLLAVRRLSLRARQILALLRDQNLTVYPLPLVLGSGGPRTILVLTPHADDETFGMAGTILSHRREGDSVYVVLVSDNAESLVKSDLSLDEIVELREREFRNAMTVLGVNHFHCLRKSAQAIRERQSLIDDLTLLFIEIQPHVLYLPSLFDNHHEHRIVHDCAAEAYRRSEIDVEWCRGYEVWQPVTATHIHDITDQYQNKVQAMHCYPSQLDAMDYPHYISGLNAYRAMTAGRDWRYAEAFWQVDGKDWLSATDRVFHTSHTLNT